MKDIIVGSTCVLSAVILFSMGYLKGKLDLTTILAGLFMANGLFLLYKGYSD